jgi:outer membrane protein assembly factor BamB
MTLARGFPALAAISAAAISLVGSACFEEDKGDETRVPARTSTQASSPQTAPVPQATLRVIDGDTHRPVRGARVSVAGDGNVTDANGLAAVPARRRATIRVSARNYGAATERVRLARSVATTVRVWRPALQWPMYGVNPARTQVHARIKLRPPFHIVWRRSLHHLLEFPAVVWNGVAYVNNIHGYLTALSMRSGRTLWRRRIGTLAASSPGLDPKRGLLVVTTMSPGDVKVLSLSTGRVLRHYSIGRSEPSPLIRDGIAYFGAANGNVYALDLDRHRMRWVFHGGAKITGSPTMVENRLYMGDYAGRVFALDARNGRVIWRGSAGTRVYGTIAAAGDRLYVPSVFSGLSALSARTGRLLWRIPVGAYLYSSPAVFRGRVYFGTYASRLYCVNARTGHVIWTRSTPGRVSGAVEIIAGVVYAATLESRMAAWSWRTGRLLWRFRAGQYVPVSGNGERLLLHGKRQIWAVESRRRRR